MCMGLSGCPLIEPSNENTLSNDKVNLNRLDIFDTTQLIPYQIQLTDSDWQSLRYEGRNLGTIAGACDTFGEYTRFRSKVEIARYTLEDVEIRKKGGLGSLSAIRPSIKLDVGDGAINAGRTVGGNRRLTLNNNHQDPSNVEQCLAYQIFNAAGIHAPRCSLVQVAIRGIDKGIYSQVENIRKPFLQRAFGNSNGQLLEGESSDFNQALMPTFESKYTQSGTTQEKLQAVLEALTSDDDQLWNTLDQLINMEYFLTFIAIEALIGHSDSYSAGQSNFYLYLNPQDNRFYFIPWGADQSFQTDLVKTGETSPYHSIYLRSELSHRVWQVKDIRDRYDTIMSTLLNSVWNESDLLAEVDRLAQLSQTESLHLEEIRAFIAQRRGQILAELGDDNRVANKTPIRTLPASLDENCITLPEFTARFNGVMSTADSDDFNAQFSIQYLHRSTEYKIDSIPGTFDSGIKTELDTSHIEEPKDTVFIRFWRETEANNFWVTLVIPKATFVRGKHRFHGFDTFGVYGNDNDGFLGLIGDGSLIFDKASIGKDAPLSGTLSGKAIPIN